MSHLPRPRGGPGRVRRRGRRNPGQWREVRGMQACLQQHCPSAARDGGPYREKLAGRGLGEQAGAGRRRPVGWALRGWKRMGAGHPNPKDNPVIFPD